MKISLLIDPDISSRILNIKTDLYRLGFRVDEKFDSGNLPHIKLAEAKDAQSENLNEIIEKINKIYENFKHCIIGDFELVNERQTENACWIALKIRDSWLKKLSKKVEDVLDEYRINDTFAYKVNICEMRRFREPNVEVNLDDCIADHLNLLTRCKVDLSDEAFKEFSFLQDIKIIKPDKIDFEFESV